MAKVSSSWLGMGMPLFYRTIRKWTKRTRASPICRANLVNENGFALLWLVGRRFKRWLRDGDVFCLYLIWYPLGRFWVEMFRPDAWRMGALATAQWFAIGGIVLGGLGLLVNHVRRT